MFGLGQNLHQDNFNWTKLLALNITELSFPRLLLISRLLRASTKYLMLKLRAQSMLSLSARAFFLLAEFLYRMRLIYIEFGTRRREGKGAAPVLLRRSRFCNFADRARTNNTKLHRISLNLYKKYASIKHMTPRKKDTERAHRSRDCA